MQYILTEQEYGELLARANEEPLVNITKKQLQALCTKIANEMPITLNWGPWKEKPTPWGCIHTAEGEWYCDSCPVQKICPEENMSWSK